MYQISKLTNKIKNTQTNEVFEFDDSLLVWINFNNWFLSGEVPEYVDYFESEIQVIENKKNALHEKYPELISMNWQLLQLDNLPGIKRLEPISDKGLKGEKIYTKDGQKIWSITTKYWFENDATYLDGVVKTVKLFNIGGDVIDSWTKEVELSIDDKEAIRKEQRERILTYFKSQQPELFGLLYTFFKANIDDYVSVGDKLAFQSVL